VHVTRTLWWQQGLGGSAFGVTFDHQKTVFMPVSVRLESAGAADRPDTRSRGVQWGWIEMTCLSFHFFSTSVLAFLALDLDGVVATAYSTMGSSSSSASLAPLAVMA
jgi:hypothetical protein